MWKKCERLLDRSLSSSVFTWRQVLDLMVPGILDSLSIMFINALITALISKNGEVSGKEMNSLASSPAKSNVPKPKTTNLPLTPIYPFSYCPKSFLSS